jgi:hypothetical protein
MSYSFSVLGKDKAEAIEKTAAELQKVSAAQPAHAADSAQAQAAADAFVDILADDAAQDVGVSVSGSLWTTDAGVQQASFSVAATLTARK